jgi:hypothetical protein
MIFLVVGVIVGITASQPQHCVAAAPVSGTATVTTSPICFRTQAEALTHLSNGEIQLAPDASGEEIDAAIEAYNRSQMGK